MAARPVRVKRAGRVFGRMATRLFLLQRRRYVILLTAVKLCVTAVKNEKLCQTCVKRILGATNVGSIRVYFDRSLQTNRKRGKFKEACLGNAHKLAKGDLVGEFRMGSTIVLIFEAPIDFEFGVAHGQRVLMGQRLGMVRGKGAKRGEMRQIQAGR